MKRKNAYAEVIIELAKLHDYKDLVFKIAAICPSAVLKAIGEASYIKECRRLVSIGEKIPAIKLWREITGDGLKEAKDAVESL